MKTHELAKALTVLAGILKGLPNQNLDELSSSLKPSVGNVSQVDLPTALSTLVALSSLDKKQWLDLIYDLQFPINVRPRDASRDVVGKLLSYLETNPDARRMLSQKASKNRSSTSPELMRALQILLNNEPS